MSNAITNFAVALVILVALFVWPLFLSGERPLGPLENIHGIPYASDAGRIIITEKLAHADIFLREPVLMKNLTLTVHYIPRRASRVSVGVRKNSFWLSYTPTVFYDRSSDTSSPQDIHEAIVTIPLTDTLQEVDRSLDLMFFAEPGETPLWDVVDVRADVQPAIPTYAQLRNYIKSIIYRERAL